MAVSEGTRWAVDGDHERLLQFTPADLPSTVPPPVLPYPNPCPAYQPDIRYKLWFADLRTYAQFHTASQLVLHYHAQHVSYDASTAMSKYDHDHHNLEDDVGGQGLVELCRTVANSQVQSFSLCLGEQIHGLASMLSAEALDSVSKALLPPRQSSTSRLTDLLVDLYALQHLPPLSPTCLTQASRHCSWLATTDSSAHHTLYTITYTPSSTRWLRGGSSGSAMA